MSPTSEELETRLAQAKSPQSKILCKAELAWRLRGIDTVRVEQLNNEIVEASQEGVFAGNPFQLGLAIGLLLKGYLDFRALAFIDSLSEGQEAARQLEKIGDKRWLSRAYNIVSMGFGNLGNYKKCLYFLDKQHSIGVELGDFESQATSLHNTGMLYLTVDEYTSQESREKFEQSIIAFEKAGSPEGIIRACGNLASIEMKDGNLDKALNYCERGMDLCLGIESPTMISLILLPMGEVKERLGSYDEALRLYEQALAVAKKSQTNESIFSVQLKLGKLYHRLESYDRATDYFDEALEVVNQSSNFLSKAMVYEAYAKLHVDQGNFEAAVVMLERYSQAKEQAYEVQRKQQAEQFEMLKNLELDAKNVEIFQLKNQKLERMVAERTEALAEKSADLQRTNNELELASQRKDAFLATMSHELRTPLNVVVTRAQALQMGIYGETTDRQKSVLQGINESSNHLLGLIDDVLDISKITSGQVPMRFGNYLLKDIVAQCVALVEPIVQAKQLKISVILPPSQIAMEVDERRVKQILINLLSNAVKFTEKGGSIELSADVTEDDLIVFCVADTGIGISKSDQDKLFVPFSQIDSRLNREYEGSGLGLALVKQFTELHGGRVTVESEIGEGSKFFVYLPKSQTIGKPNLEVV